MTNDRRPHLAKAKVRLVQLPLSPPTAMAPTGNAAYAPACLASAVGVAGLLDGYDVEVVPPSISDVYGDMALANELAQGAPAVVGFSLCMWNVERSLHIAREVKMRSPSTKIVIGGPEVEPDNAFLLAQRGFDVAVTGEGEETFARILANLAKGSELTTVPGVGLRTARGTVAFTVQRRATFPLGNYPSPYLQNIIPIDPRGATYLEVARGCLSQCSFCFYSRGDATCRRLDPGAVRDLVARLAAAGAKDFSVLDPSFNQRSDFSDALRSMAAANRDHALTFFAEVKPEGMMEDHLDLLAQAGFTRLEIGLQTLNTDTLRRVQRGGRPEAAIELALKLKQRGIDPVVDLIVGLPGDTPADVLHAVKVLVDRGLGPNIQMMPLFVLPGTKLRDRATQEGLVYEKAPPYTVIRTDRFGEGEVHAVLVESEKLLDRVLDETPRPLLVTDDEILDPPSILAVDMDNPDDSSAVHSASMSAARHTALWLQGTNLFARRTVIRQMLEARFRVDPYCTLDVILVPFEPFPLDLLDFIRECLKRGPPSYLSRHLMLGGQNAARRLCVVLAHTLQFQPDYVRAMMAAVPVFKDMLLEEALPRAEMLGESLPGARIVGDVLVENDEARLRELARRADPESVVFASTYLERWWVQNILGY